MKVPDAGMNLITTCIPSGIAIDQAAVPDFTETLYMPWLKGILSVFLNFSTLKFVLYLLLSYRLTVITLKFWTDRSGQTVLTQIRLLLEEQSDQDLHCLLFHLHHFDQIP